MSDLASRLSATLDEVERVAREALKRTTTSRRMIGRRMVDVKIEPPEWRRSALSPEAVLRLVAAHREMIEKFRTAQTTVEVSGGTVLAGAMKVNLRAYGEMLKIAARGWGLPESEEAVEP